MSSRKRLHSVTLAIVGLSSLQGCGASKDEKVGDTGTPKLTFSSDINPIIKASCSDSMCHGAAAAASVVYEDNEANFKASKKAAIPSQSRLSLTTTDPNFMPRGKTLNDTNRQKLLDFLNQ